jgi:hypothetical protein
MRKQIHKFRYRRADFYSSRTALRPVGYRAAETWLAASSSSGGAVLILTPRGPDQAGPS